MYPWSGLPGSLVNSPHSVDWNYKSIVFSFKNCSTSRVSFSRPAVHITHLESVVSTAFILHRPVLADACFGQVGSRPPWQCCNELKLLPLKKPFHPLPHTPLPDFLNYVASFESHFSGWEFHHFHPPLVAEALAVLCRWAPLPVGKDQVIVSAWFPEH